MDVRYEVLLERLSQVYSPLLPLGAATGGRVRARRVGFQQEKCWVVSLLRKLGHVTAAYYRRRSLHGGKRDVETRQARRQKD